MHFVKNIEIKIFFHEFFADFIDCIIIDRISLCAYTTVLNLAILPKSKDGQIHCNFVHANQLTQKMDLLVQKDFTGSRHWHL